MSENDIVSFIKRCIFRNETYSNVLVPTKDLNDFKTEYTSAITARMYKNSPTNNNGVYFVACIKTTSTIGYFTQIAVTNNVQGIYLRHHIYDVGWTNWITIS